MPLVKPLTPETNVIQTARTTKNLHYKSSDAMVVEQHHSEIGIALSKMGPPHVTKEVLYPHRSDNTIRTKTFSNIPARIKIIYREVIDAYNSELFILCAGGIRAIVEGLCEAQGITDGLVTRKDGSAVRRDNLQGKINGLMEKGLLTESHANILHTHRYIGNNALHELKIPSQKELQTAIEILEHTIESMYTLPMKARQIQTRQTRSSQNT